MKVLVVIDMQKDFVNGSLGSEEAVSIVQNVVEKIDGFNGSIAVTHDTHKENYMDTQEGRNLPVMHCIDGTDGWRLDDTIFDAIDKKFRDGNHVEVFMKPTFGSTELADWLVNKNKMEAIEEIVLIGLCTDICVISNALLIKAFLPEVKITVDAACCAGVAPESHNNALSAMKMCQINIENWEE